MEQPITCTLTYDQASEVYETTEAEYEIVDALEKGLHFLDLNGDQESVTILLTIKR
jgi:hypothetical protein